MFWSTFSSKNPSEIVYIPEWPQEERWLNPLRTVFEKWRCRQKSLRTYISPFGICWGVTQTVQPRSSMRKTHQKLCTSPSGHRRKGDQIHCGLFSKSGAGVKNHSGRILLHLGFVGVWPKPYRPGQIRMCFSGGPDQNESKKVDWCFGARFRRTNRYFGARFRRKAHNISMPS